MPIVHDCLSALKSPFALLLDALRDEPMTAGASPSDLTTPDTPVSNTALALSQIGLSRRPASDSAAFLAEMERVRARK